MPTTSQESDTRARHLGVRGQVLVMFALFLPSLIAMMGLGVDAAHLFLQRRHYQNVADLAALAGASQLPSDEAAAETLAIAAAGENGFASLEVEAVAPYSGNGTQIEVTVTRSVDLFFMPVLGIDNVNVSARAVAEKKSGGAYAIFAGKTTCDPLAIDWSGSTDFVSGDVHSNSGLKVGGQDNVIDPGNLTWKSGCPKSIHSDNDFPSPVATDTKPWPVWYTTADFSCTWTVLDGDLSKNGAWWKGGTKDSKKLNTGTICYHGNDYLKLSDSNISGTVTFVAKKIEISGSSFNLTAHQQGMLFFAYGSASGSPIMKLAGSNGTWQGLIFAPGNANGVNGQIEFSGSNNLNIQGALVGGTIKLNGSNFSINGTGASSPGPARLVE